MKCKGCGEDADELTAIKVNGKTKKLCEDCKSRIDEDGEIAASAESNIQGMMEFKGRR